MKVKCPKCNGTGQIFYKIDEYNKKVYHGCPDCGARGWIEKEVKDEQHNAN